MAVIEKINGVLNKFGYQAVKLETEETPAVEETVETVETDVDKPNDNKEAIVDTAHEEAERIAEVENVILQEKDAEIAKLQANLEELKNTLSGKDKEVEDTKKTIETLKAEIEEVKKTTPAVESINNSKEVKKEMTDSEKKLSVLRGLK